MRPRDIPLSPPWWVEHVAAEKYSASYPYPPYQATNITSSHLQSVSAFYSDGGTIALMDGTQTPDNQPANGGHMQLGATIAPSAATPSGQPAPPAPELPVVKGAVPDATPAPRPVAEPVAASQAPSPQPEPIPTPASSPEKSFTAGSLAMNTYDNEADDSNEPLPLAAGSMSWTASEFIAHQKSARWYGALLGGAASVALIVWLLTKDLFSAIVVLVAVGILAGYASRQPRELQYAIDDTGVTVGPKQYPFRNFRSFSVVHDGGPFSSIEFMPLKRFALPLTIYYDPEDEAKIAEAISTRVPYEQRQRDAIDALMHRIRF